MTLTAALIALGTFALIAGLTAWAINTAATAEERIRTMVSTALERPDDGHLATLARYAAIDAEYRALIANAQADQ